MFTFLHRIFVYGYNGRSGGNRGRPQKSQKISRQTETFFSTISTKRHEPKLLVKTKQCKINKTPPQTTNTDTPHALKMLQDILQTDGSTQERQLDVCKLPKYDENDVLNGTYLCLGEIKDTNEKLYFTLLGQYIDQYLPIIKTPTIQTPCNNYGLVYKKPKCRFVNIYDKGQVYDVLKKWPEHDIRAIIVTENGRILESEAPADRGAFGMGIPMSKLALYTALAGIKPHQCLPITLDVGTDNLRLLEDPAYVGIKQRRVRGEEYDDFIDEFMDACIQRFGPNTLFLKTSP